MGKKRSVTALRSLVVGWALPFLIMTQLMAENNDKRPSTMQAFAPGDVFVGATLLNNPQDDHAGLGRILQFDADLKRRGILWVDGSTHLISGLNFAPDGTLWAFDSWAWIAIRVAPDGRQLPNRQFAQRALSSVHFAANDQLVFTESLEGNHQPLPLTTRHKPLPGETDKLGDGDIYVFDADGELRQVFDPEVHGGMSGSMAVTHATLADDGRRLIYVSETGPRLMQFDLQAGQQLPDLQAFANDSGEMFFDLTSAPGGRLLVTRGARLDILDQSGKELARWPLEGFGWSIVAADDRGEVAYVANWFSGEIIKLDLASGEIQARTEIAPKCIAGLAQYPGS